MLSADQIDDLHRLYRAERWPIRKIERLLRMSWRTSKKYLDAPAQSPAPRHRQSKLDPFKGAIAEWLEKDPTVTAAVVERRLHPLGYAGGYTVLRDYVHATPRSSSPTAPSCGWNRRQAIVSKSIGVTSAYSNMPVTNARLHAGPCRHRQAKRPAVVLFGPVQ
jgi:hypothetical protein